MTTTFDAELTQDVFDLIADIGTPATFRSYDSATQSSDTSTVTLGSPTDRVVNVSPPDRRSIRLDSGGLALREEVSSVILPTAVGLPQAITFTPSLTTESGLMTVILGGTSYDIVRIDPIQSGDDIAAYEIFLRD